MATPRIDFVDVEGHRRVDRRVIDARLDIPTGVTLDPAVIEENVAAVYGLGDFTAVQWEMAERGGQQGVRVHVEQAFFHCAKAFKRSSLWKPDTWPPNLRVSFGKMMAPKFGGGEEMAANIDRMVEEDYKTNL